MKNGMVLKINQKLLIVDWYDEVEEGYMKLCIVDGLPTTGYNDEHNYSWLDELMSLEVCKCVI